jgi:hypothetical protein
MRIYLLPLLASALFAADPQPASGNFPRDLYGPADTRMAGVTCDVGPCIWGHADSAVLPIRFYPPAGYRVRILELHGDLLAWIKSLPGDPPTPLESISGVLLGFETSAAFAEGLSQAARTQVIVRRAARMNQSRSCDFCSDGTPLYVQDAVGEKDPLRRTPYDRTSVNILLGVDNTLTLVLAAWLNTTGKPIHLEGTYTVVYQFEEGL